MSVQLIEKLLPLLVSLVTLLINELKKRQEKENDKERKAGEEDTAQAQVDNPEIIEFC